MHYYCSRIVIRANRGTLAVQAQTSRRERKSGEIAQLELDLPVEQSVPET
jgi:hypothetical protein